MRRKPERTQRRSVSGIRQTELQAPMDSPPHAPVHANGSSRAGPGQRNIAWRASRASSARPIALSSGQAARYCLVSADTIVNWIAAARLPAQRTAGGQYRIRCEDLRAFMIAHGMRTELLDCDTGHSPSCWEFWAARLAGTRGSATSASCGDCPVHRSGAAVCHEVRPLLPGGTQRAPSCADCVFLAAQNDLLCD
ncbi:MAG: helix-turn-helix domain-containing protein [Pseudomonadota bacterium]